MIGARILAAALVLCATAAAGCGLGPGKDEGDVNLTVTRDYGSNVLAQKTDSIHESDTVLRVLDRSTDITTRYGGGFVQSIDGISGSQSGGRTSDWFFYVNGIESPIGAAQYDLSGGDRIWWDYRDWTAAMRVPAVVGSWPEPFVHGFQGKRWPTSMDCRAATAVCTAVSQRLAAAGIRQTGSATGAIELDVGTWEEIRDDRDVGQLSSGPDRSGVFAHFVGTKKPLLELLNQQGQPAGSIGKGGGLIAAMRTGDGPPVWVVTGTDAKGVAAAANLLGDALHNHYAVATQPGAGAIGVPVQ
ncbi:MAG TPA: DUF4430 domain-containing protein [Solirubrobacterales bacterium]|nr:DUF4430 domain-containing protein [Solirubrobacterales bacterium]